MPSACGPTILQKWWLEKPPHRRLETKDKQLGNTIGPHHLLDPIMGGPSADPGEKRGPRKDAERCTVGRRQRTPASVKQSFRLEALTSEIDTFAEDWLQLARESAFHWG